jgi:hypothetical protein
MAFNLVVGGSKPSEGGTFFFLLPSLSIVLFCVLFVPASSWLGFLCVFACPLRLLTAPPISEMQASKVTWAQQAAAQKDLTFFLFFRNEMCPVDRGWARRWLGLWDEIKKNNGAVFLISSWSEQNVHEVIERWSLPRDFFITVGQFVALAFFLSSAIFLPNQSIQ